MRDLIWLNWIIGNTPLLVRIWGTSRGRLGNAVLDGIEVSPELLDLRNLDGEGHAVAGGAQADGNIGVLESVGKDGDAAEHDAPELLLGEVGSLLAEACEFFTEEGVFKPAVEGAFSDAGGACGLGQGESGGDDGQCGLLAVGEAGKFSSPVDLSHFLPLWGDGEKRSGLGAAFGHNMSRASVAGLD